MAEPGLRQANSVALCWLHVEPLRYLCTATLAPELQWGDAGVQSAWSQLRSVGFVPQALPHTAIDIHLVDTNCNGNSSAEYKQCCTWSKNTWSLANSVQKELYPHLLNADSLTFHKYKNQPYFILWRKLAAMTTELWLPKYITQEMHVGEPSN